MKLSILKKRKFNWIIKQNKIKKYSPEKYIDIQQGVKLLLFLILVVKLSLTWIYLWFHYCLQCCYNYKQNFD
jgi:hypothetical protein